MNKLHVDLELVKKYNVAGPRYTSYPTAVQFGAQVDAAVYRGWLSALDPAQPVSLYLHIPFCRRLCWYCGCNTRAVNRHEPVALYVEALLQEMDLLRAALPGRMTVRSLHLGGGSPNMLSEADLAAVFGRLDETFDRHPQMDLAVELDPASLTEEWVRALGRHGIAGGPGGGERGTQ